MPVPSERDPRATATALSSWLVDHLPDATAVRIDDLVMPESSGYSNETLVFDAEITEGSATRTVGLVARIRPTGYAVFPEYDMHLQYRCMQVVAEHSDVPVPPLVGYEADPARLGQPFYVMEKVEGRVPGDHPPYVEEGWLRDATPAQQETLCRSTLAAIAGVGAITAETADLSFLDRPDYGPTGVGQQVGYYEYALDWALQGRESDVLAAATAWLRANEPTSPGPNVFNWGDSRPGNILYRDFRPAAVLDWEMAAVGPAEVDLGYYLMFNEYHPTSSGVDPLPGFLDRDETIEYFGGLVGRPLADVAYYETFAWYRFAMVLIRISDQLVALGEIPAEMDFALDSPATQALARRLEA